MKKIIIIILSMLLVTCEKVIDLDVIAHDSLLVINGILDKDGASSIYVTHSRGTFSSDKIESITDASVTLYENGIELGPMICDLHPQKIQQTSDFGLYRTHHEDSIYFYRHNSNPKPGSIYSIEVSHSDYEPVFATTHIPYDTELLNCEIFLDTTVSNLPFTGYYNTSFNVRFQDNPLEKNFYRLVLYNYWGDVDLVTDTTYTALEMEPTWNVINIIDSIGALRLHSNDLSLQNSDPGLNYFDYSFSGHHAMFNDDLFNGEIKEISFHIEYDLAKGNQWSDQTFLILTTYNSDGYYYFNSTQNYQNQLNIPFGSEPVPIYSNIQNGIGVLIGSTSIVHIIDKKSID